MNIEKVQIQDLSSVNHFLEIMKMEPLTESSLSFDFRKTYTIKSDGETVAFICYLILSGEAELEAIYVEPKFRNQGYGNQLMEYMIKEVSQLECHRIFLEVREKNVNAIKLYQKNGFQCINCRKGYYGNEDGFVMKKELR